MDKFCPHCGLKLGGYSFFSGTWVSTYNCERCGDTVPAQENNEDHEFEWKQGKVRAALREVSVKQAQISRQKYTDAADALIKELNLNVK